ncbi:hypothetical protein [Pseudohongiella sp.]|uniref:Uncharacterized protein n=1 Tax=marine sediment metagenome TaxID=412755 RepID=A0A0F9W912_9ZZZZ|nr:hypothetical protein [Pseudohongiella sp.]HDZ09509.1 hypothetical protein [Pseudohongiella sp.]HEA63919.1 hypothetical protein [Pseudohongiella sp.]
MDLVARYVAAVQRELPEAKRDEIGRELKANIMDKLDGMAEQHGSLTEADIAGVLKQMGRPRAVAQQFAPPQPLIRLSYMPLYQYTLFLVLGILFLLQVVETTINWVSSSDMGLVQYLFRLAAGFLDDVIFAFASITAAFWFMSRQPSAKPEDCTTDWHPEQLPKAGPSWQHISLQDTFTDLATYLFLLVVIWYPMWMSAEQLDSSRLLLTDHAYLWLKWASPLAVLGLALGIWQLQQRLWSRAMLISNLVLNCALTAVILGLAASGRLLQLDVERWHGVFELYQLERAAVTSLIIIAMFPLWEVGRDLLRLRKL